jgi:hypothetical protein
VRRRGSVQCRMTHYGTAEAEIVRMQEEDLMINRAIIGPSRLVTCLPCDGTFKFFSPVMGLKLFLSTLLPHLFIAGRIKLLTRIWFHSLVRK